MSTAYLFACGLGAIIWLACFVIRRDLRAPIVGMSVVGLPLALSDIFYVPQYWRPHTIGHVPVGIEGFIFSFEAAGICAVIYQVVFRKRLEPVPSLDQLPWRKLLSLRTLVPVIPLPVSAIIALGLDTNWEWGLYAGLILATLVTIIIRRDLALPALLGGIAFLPTYAAALIIWVAAYPGVHYWFRLWRMPHWYLLNAPLTEIVFGGLFAAFWTGIYPMVFEARFEPVAATMAPNKSKRRGMAHDSQRGRNDAGRVA